MGFIPQSNTKILYAYLTQLGRKYVLDGNKEDFQIEYFSLHDEDTNYQISSNFISGSTYNLLNSGDVPDFTGDSNSCLPSISEASTINIKSTLTGSTISGSNGFYTVGEIGTDGNINSRLVSVGFSKITDSITSNTPNNTSLISGTLRILLSSNSSITLDEYKNIKINVKVLESNSNIKNILINNSLNSYIYDLSNNNVSAIDVPIIFQFSTIKTSDSNAEYQIIFEVKPYKSFLKANNNKITLNIIRTGKIDIDTQTGDTNTGGNE